MDPAGLRQHNTDTPVAMPMDAYRAGEEYVVAFDLPGVDPASIDVTANRDVLTVRAERRPSGPDSQGGQDDVQTLLAERPHGVFSRQLLLGEALDGDAITADYTAGVLTLHIPVAVQAKVQKIEIQAGQAKQVTD